MKLYLDASVIVALVTTDLFTPRAVAYLGAMAPILLISDFVAAEFASVIVRRVRTRETSRQVARVVFAALDAWVLRTAERVETTTADVVLAEAALRRLDLPLRTADALNITIARRVADALMTFDDKMAASAKALGVEVVAA
ncbi:type II toxin-antitoxin system VapC family toxin [Rhodopila sp.]|uniref:type II toxin-antitoxin system VapC family toxin n=1 Tax=Rhodopila sp. TaxID=2480087 RepID=UPI003D124EF4